jgi:hypothetical protein
MREEVAELARGLDVASAGGASGHVLIEENDAADTVFADVADGDGALGGVTAAEADVEELPDFFAEGERREGRRENKRRRGGARRRGGRRRATTLA